MRRKHREFPEVAGEPCKVVIRDILVAKEQDTVLRIGGLDLLELFRRQLAAQIDVEDFGADGAGQRFDGNLGIH
jgi:hypothetical protein